MNPGPYNDHSDAVPTAPWSASGKSQKAAQVSLAHLAEEYGCINENDCCGYCPDGHQAAELHRKTAELEARRLMEEQGVAVPTVYEQAPPAYAIAYWLAGLQSELLGANLEPSDCMDDARDLMLDLTRAGLVVVPFAHVIKHWRDQLPCFEPGCRGGWIWVDIDDDGESVRQRCPRCEGRQ